MTSETSRVITPIRELDGDRPRGVSVVATRDDRWDARSYLVSSGTDAILIDGNGNLEPLLDYVRDHGLDLHAALLTHTHEDHVAGIDAQACGLQARVSARPATRASRL